MADTKAASPDLNSLGFLRSNPDALRYEWQSDGPDDVAAKLSSLVPQSGRILDVGCGTGAVTEIIKSRTGAEVIGIEPDPLRQAAAVQRGLNVLCGFLTEDFLREHGPFQTILFADVLEHLPSPGQMIQMAKKGLAPNGAIVASVPNIAHLAVRMNLLMGRFDYRDCGIMDATHLRWFTHKTLEEFFSNLGFTVTDHLYTISPSMPEYNGRIWRRMPFKNSVIRAMAGISPRLFGCQHVVRAELRHHSNANS